MLMTELRTSEPFRKRIPYPKPDKTKKPIQKKSLHKSNPAPEFKKDKSLLIDSERSIPIPHGDTPYALAKQAEYKDHDYKLAEHYYKQAITQGDRTESAVKDLACLL